MFLLPSLLLHALLLPALLLPALLLAAVDAKPPALTALAGTFRGSDPPYTRVLDKGDLNAPLGPTKPYGYIPASQCTAAISQIKEQSELQCSPGQVARVQVVVRDYAPGDQGYIADDLDSATITRAAPCAGDAPVQVSVGCRSGPYLSLPLALV